MIFCSWIIIIFNLLIYLNWEVLRSKQMCLRILINLMKKLEILKEMRAFLFVFGTKTSFFFKPVESRRPKSLQIDWANHKPSTSKHPSCMWYCPKCSMEWSNRRKSQNKNSSRTLNFYDWKMRLKIVFSNHLNFFMAKKMIFLSYSKVNAERLSSKITKLVLTWNNLKSTIVKWVIMTDKLDNAGKMIATSNAFVWIFKGNTRPDTL